MKQELIPIVNENDEIIWEIPRSEITKDYMFRASALDVRNSNGDILLAQRGFLKKHSPGKRSVAVAGTVEAGESYEENIYKEAEEEIGLTGYTFTKWPKLYHSNSNNIFCQYYSVIVDKPADKFVLEEWQVPAVRWFSIEEIEHLVEKSPWIFVRSFIEMINEGLLK